MLWIYLKATLCGPDCNGARFRLVPTPHYWTVERTQGYRNRAYQSNHDSAAVILANAALHLYRGLAVLYADVQGASHCAVKNTRRWASAGI
jgi:hypothetical protein